jgi:predicted permease
MFTRLTAAIRALLTRRRARREADEELQFHLEHETAANLARGMTADEARRVALRDLGGLTQTREAVREVRASWGEEFRRDSMSAWRRLWAERTGTAAALLSIAVGVGATTAFSSVAHAVLLKPLPVESEQSLFVVYGTSVQGAREPVSHPRWLLWEQAGIFDELAGATRLELDLRGDPWTERIEAAAVTDGFFRTLGVIPSLGRGFSELHRVESPVPVVISDALWHRRFLADPSVIGRRFPTGRFEGVVVGVMPAGFERWRNRVDAWVPLEQAIAPEVLASEGYRLITPFGRLRDNASLQPAVEALAVLAEPRGMRAEGESVRIVRIRDDVVPAVTRRLVAIAAAAVALTWLAICANVALVLVSSGVRRQRELAVRLALGASRARVFRQLTVEGLWLTMVGAACGLVMGYALVRALPAWSASALVEATAIPLTWPVVVATLGATVLTALAAVALSAGRTIRVGELQLGRKIAAHRGSGGSSILVAAQVSVAVVVVIGATLFLRSLTELSAVDLGFDRERVLTAELSLPARSPDSDDAQSRHPAVHRTLLEQLSAVPGVVGVTTGGPVFHAVPAHRESIAFDDGRRLRNGDRDHYRLAPASRFVGPGFMRFYGVPIRAGREFRMDDDTTTTQVVVINETMARLHWPGQDPIGRRVNFGRQRRIGVFDEPWATVVGVVADVRHGGIAADPGPEVYRALLQHPRQQFAIAVRTSIPPDRVVSPLREVIRGIEADAPLFNVQILEDAVASTTADLRYTSVLLSALAVAAGVVSFVGIFGLVATSVGARQRDHAIRLAIGATRSGLVRAVVGRSLVVLLVGAASGLIAALLAAPVLTDVLPEARRSDPAAYVATVLIVMGVGLVAAWVPARRAAAADPLVLLKGE